MQGDIFHILNRGVGKGDVFTETNDYLRFVCGLYKFNNKDFALQLETKSCFDDPPKQNKIVDILGWCLMPNHYHLLVMENVDGGAVEFTKRIGNGYTKYFNIKNKRSGYLFQNAAKIIQVTDDSHFLYLPFYIDANPIKLIEPAWKEKGIKDKTRVENFLESYRWSSHKDHIGISNFPEITNNKLFYEVFDTNAKQYKKDFLEWIDNIDDFNVAG